jgi:protein FAM32A
LLIYFFLKGGALKLKGVKDAGIKKKKKKKTTSKKSVSAEPSTDTDAQTHSDSAQNGEPREEEEDPWAGKTEAERRFEQRRLEQLEKRLAKEGIKTHKERVEEYNKYLASLSEHHDMYVTPTLFTSLMESCHFIGY